jgi:hypothetical protein
VEVAAGDGAGVNVDVGVLLRLNEGVEVGGRVLVRVGVGAGVHVT